MFQKRRTSDWLEGRGEEMEEMAVRHTFKYPSDARIVLSHTTS